MDVKQRLFVIPGQFGEIGVFIEARYGNAAQQTALRHHRDQKAGFGFSLIVDIPGVFAMYDVIDRRVAGFAEQLPLRKALAGHWVQRVDAATAGVALVLICRRLSIPDVEIYALIGKLFGRRGFFRHDVLLSFSLWAQYTRSA